VVAAGWLILEITGSPAAVGALVAVTRGPAVLLFSVAGHLADGYDRRRVGIIMFAGQAVGAVALAVVVWTSGPSLAAIYGLTLVQGVGFALSLPALLALLPTLVPEDRLSQAVSINAAGINVARLAGPAIGGITLATAGAGACFMLNAVSFLALVVALARTPPARARERGPRRGTAQAFRYAGRDGAMRRLLVGMAVFVGLAAPVQELAPVVADRLDAGPEGLGLLLGAMGGGALVGAWALERLGAAGLPRHRALPLASLAFAVGLAAVALAPTLALGLASMALCGLFWIWMYAGTNTAVQLRSPAELVGRMLGLYQLAVIGPMVVGSAVAGLVAEAIGIRASLGLCAGLLAAWGAWSLAHAVPEIDAGRGRLGPEGPSAPRSA
jgi:MFS family permease